MLNDKFINKNIIEYSKSLKNIFYFMNKILFKFIFQTKLLITKKINYLNNVKKNLIKSNQIILNKFFIKKFIKIYKNYLIKLNCKIKNLLLNIPNLKISKLSNKTKIIKYWKRKINKNLKFFVNHELIGISLGLNLLLSKNLSGYKSTVISNPILYLYKALAKFIITNHVKENNYKEIYVPYIISYDNILKSGQLPKFIKKIFTINRNSYLIPTAEVPIINILKNFQIKSELLPIKLFSNTPCFRKEKNLYGKKNRGLIRQSQFDKIELINFSDQKNSYNNLKEIVKIVEKLLRKLKLDYRIILLSNRNTGFSSSKTYDIEVWMPSINNYCEISSCSNTESYQSARTNVKYKINNNLKYIHIINGSALPLGRTLAAIIENYQYKSNFLKIPRLLKKYMNNKDYLKFK